MNCPRCHAPQGENYSGVSLNMGYGRTLPIYRCDECSQIWVNNNIAGYLNTPTGTLFEYMGSLTECNARWVPDGCLVIAGEEQLFPWLRYFTRTCGKCKTSLVRKYYELVYELSYCACEDYELGKWQQAPDTALVIWQEEVL